MSQHSIGTRAYEAATRRVGATVHNMAVQDWVLSGFHLYMWLRVMAAPDSSEAIFSRRFALALLTVTVCTVILTRGEILPEGRFRALLYRLGTFVPMVASYLELRELLPALHPHVLDAQLLSIDKALFGTTPSVWLAQFNTRPVIEWFSFFYYGYFYVLAAMVLPGLFLERGRRQRKLLGGAMVVCAVGHVTYTLVPGLGPYAHLAFEQELHGGLFYSLVWETVDRAGAMLDIFPSLHTAYPVFFSLFAFTERRHMPYKVVWPLIAFFSANMVIATMLLRWHWGIDVMAGLALAYGALRVGTLLAQWEGERGTGEDDRQPVWEPLFRRR